MNKTKSTPDWENLVSTVPHSLVLHHFIHCRQCSNTQADKGRKNIKKKKSWIKSGVHIQVALKQWSSIPGAEGLRHWSVAARLLRLWVWIPLGTWMFVCGECYVLLGRGLRQADHSSRGVLQTMMHWCVWSGNLKKEEAMAHVGTEHHRKKNWSNYHKLRSRCFKY